MTGIKKRGLWTAAVVLYVLFIYSNSMKPASLSSQDSGAALKLAQDVLNAAKVSSVWLTEHLIRKLAHFSEYTLFGVLLCGCVRSYDLDRGRCFLIYGMAGFLTPFLDETIQLFVAGRCGQIPDVWLDCGGIVFGTAIFAVLFFIWKRMEKINVKKLSNDPGI